METLPLFLGLVFATVFLLAYLLMVPTFSGDRATRKRLRKRLQAVNAAFDRPSVASLLRAHHLQALSPSERLLESLPGMAWISRMMEQAGRTTPAYRFASSSLGLALIAGGIAWTFSRSAPAALTITGIVACIPFFRLSMERQRRLDKFEEQLPDAIDTITRALRAGHPFNESLGLIGQEMDNPIAREFEITFADINYGTDTRAALLNLIERVPSISVMAMVIAVLIQRDTGGNLAEVLGKISGVIRSRFRFQRKVRTLSAEGRLSAWILSLVPFAIVSMLQLVNPEYLPMLIDNPTGQRLILGALGLMIVGLLWIRRIIHIQA